MAVRTSMASLIGRLRQITYAATDDEFGGETFWTDEQLQDVLDRTGRTFQRGIKLHAQPYLDDGVMQYTEQFFDAKGVFEESAVVRDSNGSVVTGVTIDYGLRRVTFDANPSSSAQYTIEIYGYDMNAAAAEVWETKAAHRFDWVNTRAGNHKFDFNQTPELCIERAKYYRNRRIKSWTRT